MDSAAMCRSRSQVVMRDSVKSVGVLSCLYTAIITNVRLRYLRHLGLKIYGAPVQDSCSPIYLVGYMTVGGLPAHFTPRT